VFKVESTTFVSVAAVPGPPTNVRVCNVLSTNCTVKYQLPADEGDSQVTGYHVERRLVTTGAESGWVPVNREPVAPLELVVDQLKPQSKYQFRVAAENEHGVGDFSEPSETVKCLPDVDAEGGRPSALQRCVL